MQTHQLLDTINAIEGRLPVADWAVRGVRIWPMLRFALFWRLDDTARAALAAPLTRWGPLQPAVALAQRLAAWRRARRADPAHHDPLDRPVDAVFLTMSTVRRLLVAGEYRGVFSDPILDQLEPAGVRAAVLEFAPGGEYRTPRYRPSHWVQPRLDLLEVGVRLAPPLRSLRRALGPGYAELLAQVASLGIEPVGFDRAMARQLARTLRFAGYYQRLLRRLRPAVGLMYGYYDDEDQAFCLACARQGVTSIDVQHGVNGDDNVFYGRWGAVPPEGYELLPDVFWCWTPRDVQTIRAWSGGAAPRHRAVVGDNLIVRCFQDPDHEMARYFDQQVRAAMDGQKGQRQVLLALQWLYGLPAELQEAMRRSPRSWRWWVRLHPAMSSQLEEVRRLVADGGAAHADVAVASELPVYALLRHMDVAVTGSSSVVLDAMSFGVRSVLTHEAGAVYFQEQVQAGWAKVALTPAAILDAIERQARRRLPAEQWQSQARREPSQGVKLVLDLIRRRRQGT